MEEKLKILFDYQNFQKNADLQAVIDAVHRRHSRFRLLSDDETALVSAAGMPDASSMEQKKPWTDRD